MRHAIYACSPFILLGVAVMDWSLTLTGHVQAAGG